jgi:hypothetical protein
MIPVFGTAAVLTAPSAPLLSSGYVPGNPLAAQHLNFYLYHLTKELNNVLTAVGMSQSTADDTQITQAIGRTNSVISTSGAVITAAQFVGNALVQFTNAAGSSNYLIGSGAARPGIELIVEALSGSGVMIVNGSGSAFLGSGAVRLLWDGSQWCKIGGNAFTQIFASGAGATWVTPWRGTFKCTVVGGGGGGGGAKNPNTSSTAGGGGGGGGGAAVKLYAEPAGITLTYSVGSAGTAGTSAPTSGGNGGNSTLTDGVTLITGSGGIGGGAGNISVVNPSGGAGGTGTNGDLNIQGGGGGGGSTVTAINSISQSGSGGSSLLGGGGAGLCVYNANAAGSAGGLYGGGGGGGDVENASAGNTAAGGIGATGVVMVEF